MWGVNCELSNDHPNSTSTRNIFALGSPRFYVPAFGGFVYSPAVHHVCGIPLRIYLSICPRACSLATPSLFSPPACSTEAGPEHSFQPSGLNNWTTTNKAAGTTEISAPQPREIRGSSVIEALKRGRRAGTGEAAQDETSGHRIFFEASQNRSMTDYKGCIDEAISSCFSRSWRCNIFNTKGCIVEILEENIPEHPKHSQRVHARHVSKCLLGRLFSVLVLHTKADVLVPKPRHSNLAHLIGSTCLFPLVHYR